MPQCEHTLTWNNKMSIKWIPHLFVNGTITLYYAVVIFKLFYCVPNMNIKYSNVIGSFEIILFYVSINFIDDYWHNYITDFMFYLDFI